MAATIPPLRGKITDLLAIIRILRGPDGCLWDRKQNKADIGRYLLEEAYEVIDAIKDDEAEHLKEELGDLLFQVLFLSVMAEEKNEFFLSDIVNAASEKMIRRHPHVFAGTPVDNVEDIRNNWIYIKENIENKPVKTGGFLGRYPLALPALIRAQRITERAAHVGFDWEQADDIIDKIQEELTELRDAIARGRQAQIDEEIGDLLFSVVNLSRFLGADAEQSLKKTISKFEKRFAHIEKALAASQKNLLETSPEEMNRLWDEAKEKEGRQP